jgi:hypothetical protein
MCKFLTEAALPLAHGTKFPLFLLLLLLLQKNALTQLYVTNEPIQRCIQARIYPRSLRSYNYLMMRGQILPTTSHFPWKAR